MGDDTERMIFFETARAQAEQAYNRNNQDAGALTRWGGALLELAHFRQGREAGQMILDAIERLEEGNRVEPQRADTLWCLGNAYTSQGFLTTDVPEAHSYFQKATDCFKKAHDEDPGNEVYKKALEMTEKAPDLHAQLQETLREGGMAREAPGDGGPSLMGGARARKPKTDDFWWDVAGWVTLFALAAGAAALAKAGSGPATAPSTAAPPMPASLSK